MTLTNNGDLIPEIVRRGFQELLEAEVFALTGAQFHERGSAGQLHRHLQIRSEPNLSGAR